MVRAHHPSLPLAASSAARSTMIAPGRQAARTRSCRPAHAGQQLACDLGLRSPGAPSRAGWPGLAPTASGQRCSAAPPLPLAAREPAVSVAVEGASGADARCSGRIGQGVMTARGS
jgi:hypothetical protein